MTLHFKVITNSNVSTFEKDMNNFMEKNDIIDAKYSTSNSGFSAFILYRSKEEADKESEEKIQSIKKEFTDKIDSLKLSNFMQASFYEAGATRDKQ